LDNLIGLLESDISRLFLIILSDNPEEDTSPMVELGADICVYGKSSCPMIADLAFAQLRRSTEYNPKFALSNTEHDVFGSVIFS
jgi:hypothetical protein